MMKEIKRIVSDLLPQGPMDALGVGVIDFNKKTYQFFEANTFKGSVQESEKSELYFDLASLTKPLTNSLTYFLKPEIFDPEILLCLNHRGGLPAWGLLSRSDWKKQILSYKIQESPTLYSDFSALRVMLELEKKSVNIKKICQEVWDQEMVFWTDLPSHLFRLQYGYVNSLPNVGVVHDPNARMIGEFCTHAGLYSTLAGVCRTLLTLDKKTNFIQKVKEDLLTHSHRFSFGLDRVVNPRDTLAGAGCGEYTFGHLGFTGTSFWIDPDQMRGHVILSNATKFHWYDKANLNQIRRLVGEIVWLGVKL